MSSISALLKRLDNIAESRELRAAGFSRAQIERELDAGRLIRVRRGWYGTPDANKQVLAAVRVGGRLACVSAAAFHGWAVPEKFALHVVVPRNAARLRLPDDEQVVLHWGSSHPTGRLVSGRGETVLQLACCLDAEHVGACLDSVLHRGHFTGQALEGWLQQLPEHILRSLASRSELCESFLESIGRIRLERVGITGVHQVQIAGVGRVDLVIDDWLVIEWDGLAHHDNRGAHDEDCRRDAVLATMGYRSLRFTYDLVMNHWYLVLAAIRAALAGVSRRR